ncbi:hypothetical protein Bbelb_159320 [Branchiostoma belcheri]|nr:hypothetical protein Bbelb_159320 [Branchiostoma belcheri]
MATGVISVLLLLLSAAPLASGETIVRFGVLSLSDFPAASSAMKLAVEYVNEKQLVPNVTLQYIENSTVSLSSLDLIQQECFQASQSVMAIIGPTTSSQVKASSPVGSGLFLPHIAPEAYDPTLQNAQQYPQLVRISWPNSVFSKTLVDLLEHFSWDQMSVLVSDDDFGMIFESRPLFIPATMPKAKSKSRRSPRSSTRSSSTASEALAGGSKPRPTEEIDSSSSDSEDPTRKDKTRRGPPRFLDIPPPSDKNLEQSHQAQILAAITRLEERQSSVDLRIQSLQSEIRATSNPTSASPTISWRHDSNKYNHNFNTKIQSQLQQARATKSADEKDKILDQAIGELTSRNRDILLADKASWSAVNIFHSNNALPFANKEEEQRWQKAVDEDRRRYSNKPSSSYRSNNRRTPYDSTANGATTSRNSNNQGNTQQSNPVNNHCDESDPALSYPDNISFSDPTAASPLPLEDDQTETIYTQDSIPTRFSWKKRFFMFASLPFGLSPAPFVFTKLMRPVVAHWRGQGFRCFMYLDDGSGARHSYDDCLRMSHIMRRDLAELGLMAHQAPPKSYWIPRRVGELLGYIIDLETGTFHVPDRRCDSFLTLLNEALSNVDAISARSVARIAGNIVSMGLALGPVSRLWTRSLYSFINNAPSWDSTHRLPPTARDELEFWRENFSSLLGHPIWSPSPSTDIISYSDASNHAWGGFTVQLGSTYTARGNWEPHLAAPFTSSTFRELLGTRLVLQSFIHLLANKRVLHRSDNQNVVRILSGGSRVPHLQREAVTIYSLCTNNHIRLSAEWIPRDDNERADFLSKIFDPDDYKLDPTIFCTLDAVWGPFSYDRFASINSFQLLPYSSRWWNPQIDAVDAFTVSWSHHLNWIFPPPRLIPRILAKVKEDNCCGAIVFPFWKSASWWPLLSPDGSHLSTTFINWTDLPPQHNLLSGAPQGSVFSRFPLGFRMIAARFCSCGSCQPYPPIQSTLVTKPCFIPGVLP